MSAELPLACREASRLLSAANERALSEAERSALSRHLEACLACRNFEQQLAFLRKAATRFGAR